jgi:hypothetical protein
VVEDEKGYPEPTVWRNLPVYGLFMRHIKNISVTDISLVTMQHDPRPAFAAIDVERLSMAQVKVEGSSSLPGLLTKGVKKLEVEKVKVVAQ